MKKALARLLTALMVTAMIAPDLAPLTVLAAENEVVEVGSEDYSEEATETPETASEDDAVSETETPEEMTEEQEDSEAVSEEATEVATENSETESSEETSETEDVAETSEEEPEDAPVVDMAKPMVLVYTVEDYDAAVANGENVGVPIVKELFPDDAFRERVAYFFDDDSNGVLDELEIFFGKTILITSKTGSDIESTKGVEFLRNLDKISIKDIGLETIDISKNKHLTDVCLSGNNLTSLDISQNPWLFNLEIDGNKISTLDLKNNGQLAWLTANNNNLTSLDTSKCPALSYVEVANNRIKKLDFSKNPELGLLYCQNNALETVKIGPTHGRELYEVNLSNNPALKAFDASRSQYLEILNCDNTSIANLDLAAVKTLRNLSCSNTAVSALDLSKNTELYQVIADNTPITTLKLGEHEKLNYLSVCGGSLTKLDVTGCPNLKTLLCSYNQLTSLNLNENASIDYFESDGNEVQVSLNENNEINLAEYRVDASKISHVRNGAIDYENGTITPDDSNYVAYTYVAREESEELEALEIEVYMNIEERRTLYVDMESFEEEYYTGSPCTPVPVISYGNVVLANGKDFVLSYTNNVNVGEATLTATGKGNYNFKVSETFWIQPVYLDEESFAKHLKVENSVAKYNGTVQKVAPKITYFGKDVTSQFEFDYPDDNDGAYCERGEYSVFATCKTENFVGDIEAAQVIVGEKSIAKAKITFDKKSYPFNETTGITKPGSVTVKLGKEVLEEGVDYVLTYANNEKAGNATVVASGIGAYSGEKKATYKITGIKLKASHFHLYSTNLPGTTATLVAGHQYTSTLREGMDFVIITSSPLNVPGKHKLTFKGIGGYTGSVTKTVNVVKRDLTKYEIMFPNGAEAEYASTGAKPDIKVGDKYTELVEGVDYTVTYKNNKKLTNKAEVIVKGKGYYSGTLKATFTVVSSDLGDVAKIEASAVLYKNKKNNYVPKFSVVEKATGKKLGKSHYENVKYGYLKDGEYVELSKNDICPEDIDALFITVSGKGCFTGELSTVYRFYKTSISKVKVGAIEGQVINGQQLKPKVEVTLQVKEGKVTKTVVLEKGKDYILEYGENRTAGKKKGVVTIVGIGDYSGNKTVKFDILPKSFD